jgi:uncharacterized membrane protein
MRSVIFQNLRQVFLHILVKWFVVCVLVPIIIQTSFCLWERAHKYSAQFVFDASPFFFL